MFQKHFVHFLKSLSFWFYDPTEIFKRSPVAILVFISPCYEIIGQMEILFEEKKNVYSCNSEKETGFVFLHGLNQLRMLLYEQDDQF